MSQRFTLAAKKIEQNRVFSFKDIILFHYECLNQKLVKREIRKGLWEIYCPKCHVKISVHNNPNGTLPIIKTAIDGVERVFNHDLAKEKVSQIN